MRCMTLARRLSKSGWSCTFVIGPETLHVLPALSDSGFKLFEATGRPDASVMNRCLPRGTDLLVVDDYSLDAEFESSCRGWAKRILVIDDLANRRHDCDFLLDMTPGQAAGRYEGLVPDGCRMLLGPAYALLGDRFAALRPEVLSRREKESKVENVLVSFGLTDPAGATATVVDGLLMSGAEVSVDVVLGMSAPGFERVEKLLQNNERFNLIEYTNDMPMHLAKADLAFGAAGTTSWERCCLGLPTLLMVVADNQESNAASLEESGAALNMGLAGQVRPEDVAAAFNKLGNDHQALASMSKAAARMCDGQGATRAALAIHPQAVGRDGRPVRMRVAEPKDMETVFQWQQHPDTRRFARNPKPPGREEHEAWFQGVIADPDREMFMILHDGSDAGVFRLDLLAGGAREVSILTAPECRGRGVGSAALAFANGFWPGETLHAEVLPGNAVSRKMFLCAGYEPVSETVFKRKALQ